MKNLPYFILVFLFLSNADVVRAQEKSNDRDLIQLHLKKGMILEGQLLEYVPGKYVKILSEHGHLMSVEDRKVLKYVFPNRGMETGEDHYIDRYHFKEQGFYQYTTVGVNMNTVSSNDGGSLGFQLTTSFGYQKSRLLGFGLGVSADFYGVGASEMIFPVFGEIRGYFFRQPSTPYYVIRSGYGLAWKNENVGIIGARGGWMFNPSIGWRLGEGSALKMTFDVGMQFQHAEFDYASGTDRSVADILYKRLNVRMGFLF